MSERFYPVINPATEEVISSLELQSGELVADRLSEARQAFISWGGASQELRRNALHKVASYLKRDAGILSAALTQEQGKPVKDSKSEAVKAAEVFDYYGRLLEPANERRVDGDNLGTSRVEPEACGVAAAVVPNNYPITLLAYKIAPAIAAGCAVVVKPDLQTALTTELVLERVREVGLPRGLLSSIHCDNVTADEQLLGPAGADVVSFTGSTAGGREVFSRASANGIKRMVLELGGVNSLVIEPDAPLEASLQGAAYKAFRNAGQVCHGVSSVYVHETVYETWLERFLDIARVIRLGDGATPGTELGPVATAERHESIARLVAEAESDGATVYRLGTELPERGWFYPPTVVTGVGRGARISTAELFGPVVLVEPYSTLEEVIAAINGRESGLVSYLYSGDTPKLEHFASEVECGTVGLNTVGITTPDTPFGGWKQSGLGHELGEEGLRNFQRLKHVRIGREPE